MKQKLTTTFIVVIAFFMGSQTTYSQNSDIIDNAKLIELRKLNMGDDLIIDLLRSSQTNFNCGMSSILQLKKDSISEKVIAEVMKICSSKKSNTIDSANMNNPLSNHQSGIYLFDNNTLKKMYPTVITQEKSGGFGNALASSMSYGLASSSKKIALDGPSANLKGETSSVFYFYFDINAVKETSLSNWWFSKAISPNEFTLITLNQNRKTRDYKAGKSNDYASSSGINNKIKIQFTFEEVKPGIFKVKTKENLEPGEYCFIYSATVPEHYGNDKVFDFSINEPIEKKR